VVGGGAYWPDRDPTFDNRDFTEGRDFNNIKKDHVLKELLYFLIDNGVFLDRLSDVDAESIASELVFGKFRTRFKNLRISNLIEFGRVIHAEMSALMEAARRGLPVQNGIIYTTTFPCHMCGRHIISAGLKRVVYIEPYPKSMIGELFHDLITIDSEDVPERDQPGSSFTKVSFEPFEGVAPRVYSSLFTAGIRKDAEGYTVKWDKSQAKPKLARLSTSHLDLELTIAKGVESLGVVKHKDITPHEGNRDAAKSRRDSRAESER
jgi:cytidine deaminase